MTRARHRRIDWARRDLRARVAAVTACAALVAGALAAYGVTRGPESHIRTTDISASPAAPLPPASPAEGHSPLLTRELSGPLSKTGIIRSASGVALSTSGQQATAAAATSSTLVNGIDVAAFQHPNGAAINWSQVAGDGYKFAAIKATEGTHVSTGGFNGYYANPYYVSDAQAAAAAGMYVSAYHFANPFNSGGAAQADLAAEYAGEAQNTTGTDYKVGGQYLPLMLDIEYNPYSPTDGNECYNLTRAQMVSWVSSFVTEATIDTGAAPIIYTPPAWWATCTGNSTAFGGDVLWVPAYSVNTPGTLPAGWSTWNFWQYSSSGTVAGFSAGTTVDVDYFSGGAEARQTSAGASVSIQIQALSALAGQQVTYSATGLPPGVTMSSAGLMTGTPTAAGVYQVTVTAQASSGTALPASLPFTWGVSEPPAVAVAVEGTDGQLWAQAPQLGSGWQPLGGGIIAPPAVAAPPNPDGATPAEPLFIATGTSKSLFMRTATAGWQAIAAAKCVGSPAAVAYNGTLTVACRGTNNALFYNSVPWSGTGLPTIPASGWKSLGGTLSASPAVAPVGTTLTFFVRGTNGRIFTRSATTAYVQTSWGCIGSPAAAQQAAIGVTTFACQGTDHALWEATNAGAGWSSAVSLGGALVGGPAVTATSQAPGVVAEGTNTAVFERTAAGWSSLAGKAVGGVGAAALN